MRDVPYHAYNLTPRLVVSLEAQPSPERRMQISPEMDAHKLIVYQDHRRRIGPVCFAHHSSGKKRNGKRAAKIFVNVVRERYGPLQLVRGLGLAFDPITLFVLAA